MATLREFWSTFHHQKLQNLRRSAQIFQNLRPLRFFYSLNAALMGRHYGGIFGVIWSEATYTKKAGIVTVQAKVPLADH